jgi:hypothetical protein
MALLPVVVDKRSPARLPAKMATPTATLEIEMAHGVMRFYGRLDAALFEPLLIALSGR